MLTRQANTAVVATDSAIGQHPNIATLDILADLLSRDDSIAPTSGDGIVLSKGEEANISTIANIIDNISNFSIKSPFSLTQFNLRAANLTEGNNKKEGV